MGRIFKLGRKLRDIIHLQKKTVNVASGSDTQKKTHIWEDIIMFLLETSISKKHILMSV